jgi:hypothetical protein
MTGVQTRAAAAKFSVSEFPSRHPSGQNPARASAA